MIEIAKILSNICDTGSFYSVHCSGFTKVSSSSTHWAVSPWFIGLLILVSGPSNLFTQSGLTDFSFLLQPHFTIKVSHKNCLNMLVSRDYNFKSFFYKYYNDNFILYSTSKYFQIKSKSIKVAKKVKFQQEK